MPHSDRDLFDRAIALPSEQRAAFLDATCSDAGVRARVAALLAAHERAEDGFLQSPALAVAASSIGRAGRRLGAYQIIREIGHGGMGAVYLAVRADDEYQKSVAIKIVAAPLGDDDLIRRFRRERQILAGLEHPQIARLLDGGTTDDGLPFLVMEFVEGQRIDEFARTRDLPLAERLRLFRDVCEAVQYAHSHLIVHRDLKPQNILVTAEGKPRLLDFGIATLVAEDGTTGVTRTGAAAMTPEYASPEQIRGERVTTASDVYSLGVLLYELLTGARLHDFGAKRPDEVFRLIVEDEPSRPSVAAARAGHRTLAKHLEGDLDAIVMTALRKDPERRYQSAVLLSEDLRRNLEGLPVTARGEAMSYRASKFVARHKLGAAAAAAVLITLLGGLIATTWQARVADQQRREAETQRARAERRFADVRQLANSFLFEFHDAIAPLPGSTPARRLVVTKALQYLDSLAKEASDDRALQQEVAAAYDRVGDVQGNPSVPNVGDTAGALASYQKAAAIRRALVAQSPDALDGRLSLATSAMKLGDAMVGRGAIADAVAHYKESLLPREEAARAGIPSRSVAQQAYVETTGRLCTTLLAVGDAPGALENCERNRAAADAALKDDPQQAVMRSLRAANGVGFGNVLRMVRRPQDAQGAYEDAITRFNELLVGNPSNAELRRRLAVTYGFLATVQLELKNPEGAARSLESAITQLTELTAADPSNVRSFPELAFFLNRRAQTLMSVGRRDEARNDALRAIALLRTGTERPGAGGDAFNEYAWALVSYEPDDVRNPALALEYANRAIQGAGSPNASYMHTLAWAQYRLGNATAAVQTLEKALALLPAGQPGPAVGLRRQIETDLNAFKAGTPSR